MFEIYSVIDTRTNKTVYTSKHQSRCDDFITDQCNENHEASEHLLVCKLMKNRQMISS